MDIKNILQTLPKIPKRKQGAFDTRVMHPVREWLIGLLFSFVVIGVGGAVSAYTFLQYTDIAVTESSVTQSHSIYNQTLAQTALKLYQSRRAEFNVLKNIENKKAPTVFEVASSSSAVELLQVKENKPIATTTETEASGEGTQLAN